MAFSKVRVRDKMKTFHFVLATAGLLGTGCSFTQAQDALQTTSLPVQTSWTGNTFGGANDKWVQNYIDEIEVVPDGTVYAHSEWGEARRTIGVHKNGDVVPTMLKQYDGAGGHKALGWGTAC